MITMLVSDFILLLQKKVKKVFLLRMTTFSKNKITYISTAHGKLLL